MEKKPRTRLIWFLEGLKEYQRPVRTCLWTLLIATAFILCLCSCIPCTSNYITESILMCMFADMGIYTVSRSIEKAKGVEKPSLKKKVTEHDTE